MKLLKRLFGISPVPAKSFRTRSGKSFSTFAPEGLKFREAESLRQIEVRFEQVFRKHESYWENVKDRLFAEHPGMSEKTYSWLLFEFKRFLGMNILLKKVGMYSSSVDEVWHAALMFTQQYQTFCEDLLGSMVHHAPHVGNAVKPGKHDRALFELVYSTIFEVFDENITLLGKFNVHKLDPKFLNRVLSCDRAFLLDNYFKTNLIREFEAAAADTVSQIIEQFRTAKNRPQNRSKSERRRAGASNTSDSSGSDVLNTILFWNLFNDDGGKSTRDSSCSSESHDSGSGSSSGSDGSSSSCSSSSCGSSCSS
ncbi:hypothetical protein, partial [Paenibacillus beijingensis]|uniref:hypothetical protein n=1 Tax=Paenibacillus beijingensis TaxID=1126833 RepID=UPI0005F2406F